MSLYHQTPRWEDVRTELRGALGEAFPRWFAPVTGTIEHAQDGACVLCLHAPSALQRDWIREQYSSTLEAVWRRVTPRGVLLFAVQEPQAERPQPEQLPSTVMPFPCFPSATRAVSNAMARSALFSCVQSKDRQMLQEALLAAQDGIDIRFTGWQLNQDDHDVLMQLVDYAKQKPLGDSTTVPAYALLTALGRQKGGEQYRQ